MVPMHHGQWSHWTGPEQRDTTTSLTGGNKLLCNMILEQRTAQLEIFEAAQAFE